MAVSTQQVSGTVGAANDKGIRLDGADTWLNWSKFADGRTVVGRGDQVVCSVDAAGFLRAVTVVDAPAAPAQRAAATSAAPARGADRDVAIIRQCAVKAAAQLFAGSGDVDAALAAARRFEQFVLGNDGTVDPESDLPF